MQQYLKDVTTLTVDKIKAYYKEVGKRLRLARENAKLSQEDVAHKIGSTNQKVSSFETGRTRVSLETLNLLCEIYHVEPDFIMAAGKKDEMDLSSKLEELVSIFKSLRADFQDCALEQIKNLAELQEKKNNWS